ncbi:hypothetical protein [Rubinisphaera sp. JC750]|uniref:hypothetical protein n=1 Tax=Rubinisphaera sp. JC750 TaxID=2898658 RepID=UPI001F38D1BD|nr:hypothetical protein [Rubinisphaera sp. JC750]
MNATDAAKTDSAEIGSAPLDTANLARSARRRPPIEIGFVLAGRLDDIDRNAVQEAIRELETRLAQSFPEFRWQLNVVRREEMSVEGLERPIAFFQQGQAERDAYKWDFVFVITSADLIGYFKPFALAAVSRTLDLVVVSTARVDPKAVDIDRSREDRIQIVSRRIAAICLRSLGVLCGLDESEDPADYMWPPGEARDLDGLHEFSIDEREEMEGTFEEVADLRLEERSEWTRRSLVRFYANVAWTQRRQIFASVLQAAPWKFPFRLSRLSTAAFSALLVLQMTAEVWHMALHQSTAALSGLLVASLFGTTGYVIQRQGLFVRRQDRHVTEQIAVSNITAGVIVFAGLLTTLLLLFSVSFLLGATLFPSEVIASWIDSDRDTVATSRYTMLSAVVAAFGLAIGALGAAFEDQSYFRHVIFVDEEL